MSTYVETVYRYRILRHEDLPESHKAAYRLRGIDPDDNWSLIWSFKDRESAEETLASYVDDPDKPSFYTYKMVDAGQTDHFERQTWF